MAGSYPDPPGYRFAYDQDGTVAFVYNTSLSETAFFTSAQLRSTNSDTNAYVTVGTGNVNNTRYSTFIFPELRDVTGILYNSREGTMSAAHWSNDTISGFDGTWNAIAGFSFLATGDKLRYKTDINSVNLTSVKALRFTIGGNWGNRVQNIHIYGSIPTDESIDRLRIVDATDQDIVAQLDFGNLLQRASATRQFKIINNSTTMTANSITVSLDVPSDASPSLLGQYQVSTDNVAFANAVNIGTLAPSQESGILYIRMNPASNAVLGPWNARIIAHPTSWS